MKARKIIGRVPIFIVATLLAAGCANNTQLTTPENVSPAPAMQQAAPAKADNVIKGKLLGVSQKAMTVTVAGPDGPVLVKFNGDTMGLKYLKKGSAAIITFKTSGKDKIATEIKPKLAKLPQGVAEIQPDELAQLVALGPEKGNYMLIDARPTSGYAKGHISSAVSIPVPKMKAEGKNLIPQDNKDKLLIFYCGGPT